MQDAIMYQRILNSLSEGVLTLDAGGTVQCFNEAAQRMLGLRAEQVVGRPFGEVFMATTCELRPMLERTLHTGRPITEAAVVMMTARQENLPVSVNIAPIIDGQGTVQGVVTTFRDVSDLELLRRQLHGGYVQGDIISKNAAVRRVLDILPDVAASDATVLILGESGTGKELLARAVHTQSPRSAGPFVAVNCGALPDTLLESELFGYEKGAFTDARRDKPGRFALAEGGTLFLDEIGDLSTAMQVKLLRVLQERTYEPLGSTRTLRADVRVVAATHRDLPQWVAEGRFRADLYYRLNVVPLTLPPLRQRREDLPLLIDHFIHRLNTTQGRTIRRISRAALNRLMRYDFPGNIRELENIIEHAAILCRGEELQEGCLPPHLLESATPACYDPAMAASVPGLTPPPGPAPALAGLLPQQERALIERTLAQHGGHRGRTAQALGIHPATLWRKLKKLQMES